MGVVDLVAVVTVCCYVSGASVVLLVLGLRNGGKLSTDQVTGRKVCRSASIGKLFEPVRSVFVRRSYARNLMVDIRVGDRIKVIGGKERRGVVTDTWGSFASVQLDEDGKQLHVPLKNLESLDVTIRAATEAQALERRTLLARLRSLVKSDFLNAEARFFDEFDGLLSREDLDAEKALFVREWVANRDNLREPDPEQASAIACVNGNTQIVARAGSGKTTTLVNRAVFLLKHCGVAPGEMLLLAFNRKAAREIKRHLLIALIPESVQALETAIAKANVGSHNRSAFPADLEAVAVDGVLDSFKGRLPHVMTFHALAYAIVHPEGRLLYDGSDGDSLGLSRAVQDVIDEFIRNPRTYDRVRSLMTAHFREDWDRIIEGGFHLSKADQLALLRSLPRETLAGDFVKSAGEKAIADFLFEQGVPYRYERNHWWDGVNYKPDFTIFETERSGVVIEYFGLTGDPTYDEQIERKRKYWSAKPHWKLIELYPNDVARGIGPDLERKLTAELLESGIVCARLSEEDVWSSVRVRAVDRFTKAAAAFVGRCRKKAWDSEEAARRVRAHTPASSVEEMFLSIGMEVFGSYVDRLAETGDEDFDGLMQRAADKVQDGVHVFANRSGVGDIKALKYVCIDEYQDFSELFYRLIDALRNANPTISFFCVGDDWQAINGFAGSELRFFEDFDKYFGASERRAILTNYRSTKAIVNVGNAVMHGKGAPGRANANRLGRVWTFDMGKFKPSLIELQRHPGDVITPLTGRLVHKFVREGKPVVLLSRRNGLPWYVKANDGKAAANSLDGFLTGIRSMLPEKYRDMVTISTAHKYKGLEKSAVIILDAVDRSYPLVHPDWPFYRIFGDEPGKITEDERRLFYVALTRAIDDLVIVTGGENPSPFLAEIAARTTIATLPINVFPPVPSPTNPRVLLKVISVPGRTSEGGTFPIKDLLRASRFQYDGTGRFWERTFVARVFDLKALQGEPWARAATGVHAFMYDEQQRLLATYAINEGTWRSDFEAWHLLDENRPPGADESPKPR